MAAPKRVSILQMGIVQAKTIQSSDSEDIDRELKSLEGQLDYLSSNSLYI